MNNIYLDNAATTRIDEQVFEAMEPYLKDMYGNPSAGYSLASKSKRAVNTAREQVAALINAEPDEIYFTSGGTESDNCAINGFFSMCTGAGKRFLTTPVEHPAVLKCAEMLKGRGVNTVMAPIDFCGRVDIEELKRMSLDNISFASIMYANNEIGSVNDIKSITEVLKDKDIPVHTDAVQAIGHIKVDVRDLFVDALSASGHKFHGPKGVGFIYIRRGVKMPAFILGGGQENGLRSGTENVAGIVGLGTAADMALRNLDKDTAKIRNLRDYLTDRILSEIPDSRLNGPCVTDNRLCNNANFSFRGVNGASLIIQLDMKGIAASTGSACATNREGTSHVLQAINVPEEYIDGSLRLSLSKYTTKEEIDYTVPELKKSIEFLRQVAG